MPTCSDSLCIFWLSVLHAAHRLSNPWQRPANLATHRMVLLETRGLQFFSISRDVGVQQVIQPCGPGSFLKRHMHVSA